MTSNQSAVVFFAGLILTFGAVGGLENSLDTAELAGSVLLAVIGLAAMYLGAEGLGRSDRWD
jgi:hypothetical protein